MDDDGKVHLYVGNSPAPGLFKTILKMRGTRAEEAVCLELEPDMITVKDGTAKSDEARKKDKKNLLPYFTQSGEDREENGEQYIANLRDGAWCGFKYFAFDGTESRITVTVRGQAEGTLKVFTNGNMVPVASVLIRRSEDWASYSASLLLPAGTAPLYFVYEGAGSMDFSGFEIG